MLLRAISSLASLASLASVCPLHAQLDLFVDLLKTRAGGIAYPAGISNELRDLLNQCLQRDPVKRPDAASVLLVHVVVVSTEVLE